ncbi:MAG: hypothetical protein AB8G99_20030 [Planctomycetaceae bacterium]
MKEKLPIRNRPPWWFILASALLLIWPIVFCTVGLFTPMLGTYIGFQPNGEDYDSTRFEFRYGHSTRIVDDPHNKMQWISGNPASAITMERRTRVVVFTAAGSQISSWADTMSADEESLKYAGYMGIRDAGTRFAIDARGRVRSVE